MLRVSSVRPHDKLSKCAREALEVRKTLPYGVWRYADGSEVLFNRDCFPIYERTDTGEVVPFSRGPAPRGERIEQSWFYKDETPIPQRREIGMVVLRGWGVPPQMNVYMGRRS